MNQPNASHRLTTLTSAQWHEHYLKNADCRLDVPWERGAEITASEKRAIGKSLQACIFNGCGSTCCRWPASMSQAP